MSLPLDEPPEAVGGSKASLAKPDLNRRYVVIPDIVHLAALGCSADLFRIGAVLMIGPRPSRNIARDETLSSRRAFSLDVR